MHTGVRVFYGAPCNYTPMSSTLGLELPVPPAWVFVSISLVGGDVDFPQIACISNYTRGRSVSTLSVVDG